MSAPLAGLTVRWSLADAPEGVEDELVRYVADTSHAKFTGMSGLRFKSSDFPAEMFAGMDAAQKYAVMKVMNDNVCDCGCSFGTYASCLKNDPNCPKSPAMLKQAIALARAGYGIADYPGAAVVFAADSRTGAVLWKRSLMSSRTRSRRSKALTTSSPPSCRTAPPRRSSAARPRPARSAARWASRTTSPSCPTLPRRCW